MPINNADQNISIYFIDNCNNQCMICVRFVLLQKKVIHFLLPFTRANKNKIRLDLKTGDLHVKNYF